MGAVGSKSQGKRRAEAGKGSAAVEVGNVDGAVRDEDLFAIGDEEDEDGEEMDDGHDSLTDGDSGPGEEVSSTPPPAYVELGDEASQSWSAARPGYNAVEKNSVDVQGIHGDLVDKSDTLSKANEQLEVSSSPPSKYYIRPGDTLTGIALRFGIDVRLSLFLTSFNLTDVFLSGPYTLPPEPPSAEHTQHNPPPPSHPYICYPPSLSQAPCPASFS